MRVLRNSETATRLLDPSEDNAAPYELFFKELMVDPSVKQRLHEVFAMKDLRYPMGGGAESGGPELLGRAAPDFTVRSSRGGTRLALLQHSGRATFVHGVNCDAETQQVRRWRDRVDIIETQTALPDGLAGMLIRPDGYIAWARNTQQACRSEELKAALHTWFGSAVRTAGADRPDAADADPVAL